MSDSFKPALPHPIKYTTSDNTFEDSDKYPKSMSWFVPVASITPLAEHLMKLADTKTKTAKVWDYENKKEIEVEGVWINAKGKEGQDGDFGNLYPKLIESPKIPEVDEIPF